MHLVIVIMNYVMLENNSDTRIYDTFNKMWYTPWFCFSSMMIPAANQSWLPRVLLHLAIYVPDGIQ